MKWYSHDGKLMVDLDKITSFKYYDRSDLAGFSNPFGGGAPHYINEVKQFGHFIILYEGGYEFLFRGTEALEIYNILKQRKQIL